MSALENIEAEAALLGALMIDNGQIDRVADTLDPADFYEPTHGRIYEAIIRQAALGKAATAITIKGYFEGDEGLNTLGGLPYLARLSGNAEGMLATFDIARHLRDLASRRRMRAGLLVAAEACADMDSLPSEIIGHADAALSGSAKEAINTKSLGECFDELLDSFGKGEKGVFCQTIPALDSLLGPMKPKQLVIGAGRPGMGKTAVALSYALGAAEAGHGVLFVSLEMSAAELVVRAASGLSFSLKRNVPFGFIRDDKLDHGQKRAIAEIGSMARSLPFEIVDTQGLTAGRLNMLIRRHARKFAARGEKLELVVVDYLQLLHPDTKGRSAYEAVSEVSRSLKAMAKENDVSVFALAQLSRSVEARPDKRPQISDLRDSGQIEQDADAVLLLFRPEYYLKQAEPAPDSPKRFDWEASMRDAEGLIEFILAKRRNGVTGSAFGEFHGAYQAVTGT